MNDGKIGRRTFIQGASLAALSAAGLLDTPLSQAQVAVPNSAGTELPRLKAPALASCGAEFRRNRTAETQSPSACVRLPPPHL